MPISKEITNGIVEQLIRIKFNAEAQTLQAEEAGLALEVYNKRWTEEEILKMEQVPDGWLDTTTSITVTTDQGRFQLRFSGSSIPPFSVPAKISKIWPKAGVWSATEFTLKDEALVKRVLKHAHKVEDLKTAIKQAETAAAITIRAAGSLPKLIKLWPEVEPYAAPYMVTKVQLPAIQTVALNEMFGLPV